MVNKDFQKANKMNKEQTRKRTPQFSGGVGTSKFSVWSDVTSSSEL